MSNSLYYPNRFAFSLFQAMEEVMGQHGLDEILALAEVSIIPTNTLAREFPFEKISAINAALDTVYGGRGGRGMALRTGRAWFSQGMKTFGALSGIADPAFRRLPLQDRIRLALQAQAEIFTSFSDQQGSLEVSSNSLRFVIQASPFAWGRSADKPVCHPLVGLLQECTRWASNGRDYTVREIACIASGDPACIIQITP